jgi:hypothetical protein
MSSDIDRHPYLDRIGFVVNNVMRCLICEPCGWAMVPDMAQGHLDETHKGCGIVIERAIFEEAMELLDVGDALPVPPTSGIYPQIVGLLVLEGFGCGHCDKALGTKGSMEKHHRASHPEVPPPKTWKACDLQQFHPNHAKTMIQIRRRGSQVQTAVDDMIANIRKEMAEVTLVQPYERNARAISPWILTTKWDKHIAGFDVAELRALVAMPKKEEFPGLIEAVRHYFEQATDLIDHTDELVLQHLNSPDPEKELSTLFAVRYLG